MIFIKMWLISAIMISGYQHAKNKKVEVTGKALNAKAGAIVIGVDQIPYYLEGMEQWDRKIYGKKVRVTGTLVILRSKKPNYPPAQEILVQRIIKKPKWQLIK